MPKIENLPRIQRYNEIEALPPELVEYILSMLPIKDLLALSGVNRYFYDFGHSDPVWRERLALYFGFLLKPEHQFGYYKLFQQFWCETFSEQIREDKRSWMLIAEGCPDQVSEHIVARITECPDDQRVMFPPNLDDDTYEGTSFSLLDIFARRKPNDLEFRVSQNLFLHRLLSSHSKKIEGTGEFKPLFSWSIILQLPWKKINSILQDLDISFDDFDVSNRTALMYAVQFCSAEMIQKIIDSDASVDRANEERFTALMLAAIHGRDEAVEILIQNNASIEQEQFLRNKALYFAVLHGHAAVVKLLVDAGALFDFMDGLNLLRTAASRGALDVVKYFLDKGVSAEETGLMVLPVLFSSELEHSNALSDAAYHNHVHIVQFLIKSGTTVDLTKLCGWTALQIAAMSHSSEFVGQLIEKMKQFSLERQLQMLPTTPPEGMLVRTRHIFDQKPETIIPILKYLISLPMMHQINFLPHINIDYQWVLDTTPRDYEALSGLLVKAIHNHTFSLANGIWTKIKMLDPEQRKNILKWIDFQNPEYQSHEKFLAFKAGLGNFSPHALDEASDLFMGTVVASVFLSIMFVSPAYLLVMLLMPSLLALSALRDHIRLHKIITEINAEKKEISPNRFGLFNQAPQTVDEEKQIPQYPEVAGASIGQLSS